MAADIGGTKTDLALFGIVNDRLEEICSKQYKNALFSGIEEAIEKFLRDAGCGKDIDAAVLGVAAPVEGERSRLTNLDWEIDSARVSRRFSIPSIKIVNDLVATAMGLVMLRGDHLECIQEARPRLGNGAIIAPGTGLGEAIIFFDGIMPRPSASEGGHTDFAPRTPVEMGLFAYLNDIYGHVSYERVLSGHGLKNIYDFLTVFNGIPGRIKARFQSEDPPAVITDEARRGDKVCAEALDIFVSILGAEAGNLALKSMAVSGVYVCGGIAPKILDEIKRGGFVEAFRAKGRFFEFMKSLPVNVVVNPRTALLGAAKLAGRLVIKEKLKIEH